jgi:uncharacterized membrane protein
MASMLERLRTGFALFLGAAFVWIGVQHFTGPEFFEPIVPDLLGHATFWVYASGVVEIAIGAAMMIPVSRSHAGKAMAVFLIVLYWANLNMWLNDIPLMGTTFSNTAHMARAVAQLGMIALALFIARGTPNQVQRIEEEG